MVIPSFSAFAPGPKLAESMLAGVASTQRDVAEANRVAIARQQIQLQQQKLQQEAVQSNMELEAKKKAHQDQMMRDQQEMLIKQQYDQNMIGLRQQQLEKADEMVKLKTLEVSRKFQANQQYRAAAQQSIEGGEEPQEAYSKAAMQFGPEMGMTGAGMGSLLKRASMPAEDMGQASAIEGLDPEQYKKVRTSQGGYHVVHLPPNMDASGPAPAGYVRSGNRILPEREPIAVRTIRKEISDLEKTQDKDIIGKFAAAKADKGDTLSPDRKRAFERYQARSKQIEDLRSQIPGSKKAGTGKFKEGQVITHRKTGDKYRVTNGVPVLMQSESDDTEGEDNLE